MDYKYRIGQRVRCAASKFPGTINGRYELREYRGRPAYDRVVYIVRMDFGEDLAYLEDDIEVDNLADA